MRKKEKVKERKNIQNISNDLEDIRTKLVKLITYYIWHFVENEKRKYENNKNDKLNLYHQNIQRKKNYIKIKGDKKEHVKLQNYLDFKEI